MREKQRTSKKKRNLAFLMMAAMLLLGLALFNLPQAAHAAAAGGPLSVSTQAALEEKMKSKFFTYEGTTYHINEYYDLLYKNNPQSRVSMSFNSYTSVVKGKFIQTDPITSLIPSAVFNELRSATGIYWYMGEQWGVIIDPICDIYGNIHFVVQLIDIDTANCTSEPSERYTLEIKPLFELEFIWISNSSGDVSLVTSDSNYSVESHQSASFTRSGAAGLYALPSYDIKFNGYPIFMLFEFKQVKRNYINNFSFAGTLANEQEANPGHSSYEENQDYGAFFIGSDMNFNAYSIDDLTNPKTRVEGMPTFLEGAKTALGIASIFIPGKILGIALSAWDILDLIKDIDITTLPPDQLYNYTSSTFLKYDYSTHSRQIDNYGRLIKDCSILLNNEDFALSALGSEESYAKAMFRVTQQRKPVSVNPDVWESRYWQSRLSVGFKFDIRRYGSNGFVDSAVWEKNEILENTPENYKTVGLGQQTVYNYHNNTSRLAFTAPTAGYYRMYFEDMTHDSWYNNFSTSEIYLNATQVYNFELEYKYDDKSISQLIIERTDLKLELINGGTAYSVSGLVDKPNIEIPSYFRGLPVTEIAEYGFSGLTRIASVTFESPCNIQTISSYAFDNTCALTSFTVPDSVTGIGYSAFKGWNQLETITLPFVGSVLNGTSNDNFGYIFGTGDHRVQNSFIPSSLSEVIITGGNSIGSCAFYGCLGLSTIVLPNSISKIGNHAFYKCTALVDIGLPDGVTSIGTNAFYRCTSLTGIILPDGVTSIGRYAFYECTGLTAVVMPDTVSSIGDRAFYGCKNLLSINIPSSLKKIDDYAFYQCYRLTNIDIPQGVSSIGNYAFTGCSNLANITIPDSVTGIGISAFHHCSSLDTIILPDSIASIGSKAFYNCSSLTSITIPSGLTIIEEETFSYCAALSNVMIPINVRTIRENAFYNCYALTTLNISNEYISVAGTAFDGSGISSVAKFSYYETHGLSGFGSIKLYLRFDNDPAGLSLRNISVSGGSISQLEGSGRYRSLVLHSSNRSIALTIKDVPGVAMIGGSKTVYLMHVSDLERQINIPVLVPNNNDYFRDIILSLYDLVYEQDIGLMVMNAESHAEAQASQIRQIIDMHSYSYIEKVIIWQVYPGALDYELREMRDYGIFVLELNAGAESEADCKMAYDYFGAGYQQAMYIIESGNYQNERIEIFTTGYSDYFNDYYLGMQAAINESGYYFDVNVHILDYYYGDAEYEMHRLIDMYGDPAAVISFDSYFIPKLQRALRGESLLMTISTDSSVLFSVYEGAISAVSYFDSNMMAENILYALENMPQDFIYFEFVMVDSGNAIDYIQ